MIIERLELKAFGKFTDVSIDLSAGPKKFHLVYGPNESGKSTSLRAITSLLFGMPHVTEDNYLHTNAQMRVGGVLSEPNGNRLECFRRRGRKATLRDAADSDPIEESVLSEMLGGIDRETFLTRFGLSHDELVEGGASILKGEGDLGQILFAAGAGVSKLREIQDQLDQETSRLFAPRSTKATINAAIRDLDEKRKELVQSQLAPMEFIELRKRLDLQLEKSNEFNESVQRTVVELARLRAYQQAIPLVPQWRSDIESLAKVSRTPMLDEAFTERRRQAISDREVALSRHAELENRIRELTTRMNSLPVDAAVMNHESEIQAVFQELATRDKADRDRLDLIRVQKNADRKIMDLLRELAIEINAESESEKEEAIHESVERLRLSDALRSRVHELASQYERLIGQRNDASDTIETTKRRLADASQELESLGNPVDPASLNSVIESVGAPQTLLEGLREHEESCGRLERRCEGLLRRLVGFEGTIRNAAAIRPPSETAITDTAALIDSANRKLESCKQQASELLANSEQIERQLEDQQTAERLPTIEELQASRSNRDRLVDSISSGKASESQIAELREQVRLADEVVDTIRTHHEKVHARQMLVAKIESFKKQITEKEKAIKNASKEVTAAKEQWLSLWETCQVKADSPERMQRWLLDHEQLIETQAQLADEEKRRDHFVDRVAQATKRLQTAIASSSSKKRSKVAATSQGGLFDEPPEPQELQQDLLSVHDEAVSLRSKLTRARKQFDTVAARRDELTEELPEAETRFEASQKTVETWREDWRRITESFANEDQSTPKVVMAMIRRIDELCEKKRERDILATRIRSIRDDELSFASRIQRLASVTNPSPNEEPQDLENELPSAIAHTLYQRLQAERSASRQRESLREQIEAANQRLAEVTNQRSTCDVTIQQLCTEAGCESAEDLPDIERAARERERLQASLRDSENQLAILAEDQSIEELVQAVSEVQPALLEEDIHKKEQELARLREEQTTCLQETGALKHKLELMDGSSRASELSQSIQFVAGQINHDAESYARSKIASLILRKSIDHYRRENQSPVLAIAEKTFSQLTCGEYSTLKIDYDAKGKSTLFGVRSDSRPDVPAHAMSTGTADALYLAMRVASLEHQLSHSTPIPVVIDDCLIQLDDARAAAALKVFSDLSATTQVILFTHHEHLCKLAQQELGDEGVHLHQLPA